MPSPVRPPASPGILPERSAGPRAVIRRGHEPSVLRERPRLVPRRGGGPPIPAGGQLVVADAEVDPPRLRVDDDLVALLDEGDRAAHEGFGRDVPHAVALRRA